MGYSGPTTCAAGSTCVQYSAYYSQCTPSASAPSASPSSSPSTNAPSSPPSVPSTSPSTAKPTTAPTTSSPPATTSGGPPPITNNGVSSYNWCGKRKWIALMFDDWWPSPAIDDILADLKANNMKASFFLAPGLSSPDPNICTKIKNVLAAGHSVNAHSYTHQHFTHFTAAERATEMKKTEDVVYTQCGLPAGTMKQFRPPYGDLNKEIALEVNKDGYTVISWTYDPVDWDASNNKLSTVWPKSQQLFSQLPSGSSAVILHHTWAYTSSGTKGLLANYKNYFAPLGYQFVTVDQCFDACRADGNCKLAGFGPGLYDF
ncbi:unnamed protein product [Aphanomyces euteiches]|uniref:NodB homology domain-containing protein n=1 Tax=Aphanomyces euteiches TaxID=100861 RepID=A0A6G0WCV6_9STRA|nr:hypothetical protein Ae201684_016363 [Aphanomyces euteiches]KAH9079927.1 hypothetical protein Ae201684P_007635 [Aphanomyces euteiches]KAH9133638.1 hypothetical protein AeRB84_020300 [Aphanomyces euteiches]